MANKTARLGIPTVAVVPWLYLGVPRTIQERKQNNFLKVEKGEGGGVHNGFFFTF